MWGPGGLIEYNLRSEYNQICPYMTFVLSAQVHAHVEEWVVQILLYVTPTIRVVPWVFPDTPGCTWRRPLE